MGGLELQMSWLASLVSQKRKTGGPLGLKNLGNTCYLNSVLQCLTYTPPLANFCLRAQHSSLCDSVSNGVRKRECPFCILEKRIARSLRAENALDAPKHIQSCLRIFAEHFRDGRQEDAHEFLRYVIDACHNTCLRLKKLRKGGDSGNGDTVVKQIFGGTLQSQVKCLSCHSDSNKADEIMDISLDVLHSNTLKEAMHKFFQPEILDGNNKYKCENCEKLVAARKQMSILQAPNILVIQLKRFEGVLGGKIDKAIAFQEVLVLSNFMCKTSKACDPQPEYTLFGTIVHSGYSPESGHYYAYIKDAMGRWYCCNDSYISLSTLQDVLSEKVYILFFSRTNKRQTVSNGVKSQLSNGNDAIKGKNASDALAKLPRKLHEEFSKRDASTPPKRDKVLSSAPIKFNIVGNFGSKSVPPTARRNFAVDNSQGMQSNGHVGGLAPVDKFDKHPLSISNGNGFINNKTFNGTEGETARASPVVKVIGSALQNGAINSSPQKNNGISSSVTTSATDQLEMQNGQENFRSASTGFKRKSKESCILLAEDSQSHIQVDELKKALAQEASSTLRFCGWYDDVYDFMCSKKRLCAQEMRKIQSGNDRKKMLIADAKATFNSRIPEPLKEVLIKSLRNFA